MKKLAFTSGALAFSCVGIGLLFKIQHWPMANILAVLGLGLFSIIFVPTYAKYLYDKNN